MAITLSPSFLEWEWFGNADMVKLFLYLLLRASDRDKRWQGIVIRKGQLVTSRSELSKETGISERTLRTCLGRLQESGEINIKSTKHFSTITICNYDSYQGGKIESDQQPTNNRPTTDQQPTNTAKEKESQKENNPPHTPSLKEKIKEKENADALAPYLSSSSSTMAGACGSACVGVGEGAGEDADASMGAYTPTREAAPSISLHIAGTAASSPLQAEADEMKANQTWVETACMKFRVTTAQLRALIGEFAQWCSLNGLARGHPGGTPDALRHFVSWMLRRQQSTANNQPANHQPANHGHNQSNGPARGYYDDGTEEARQWRMERYAEVAADFSRQAEMDMQTRAARGVPR